MSLNRASVDFLILLFPWCRGEILNGSMAGAKFPSLLLHDDGSLELLLRGERRLISDCGGGEDESPDDAEWD